MTVDELLESIRAAEEKLGPPQPARVVIVDSMETLTEGAIAEALATADSISALLDVVAKLESHLGQSPEAKARVPFGDGIRVEVNRYMPPGTAILSPVAVRDGGDLQSMFRCCNSAIANPKSSVLIHNIGAPLEPHRSRELAEMTEGILESSYRRTMESIFVDPMLDYLWRRRYTRRTTLLKTGAKMKAREQRKLDLKSRVSEAKRKRRAAELRRPRKRKKRR